MSGKDFTQHRISNSNFQILKYKYFMLPTVLLTMAQQEMFCPHIHQPFLQTLFVVFSRFYCN